MNFAFLNGRHIFITGGTGFVGSHLLPLLADAGASVIVLVRPTSDISHLPTSVKTVQVSLTDSAGLSEAIRGSDTVIHMAALLFGLGWQDYLSANARAAASLAEACSRLGKDGPRRFIHVSSLSAAGPCCTEEGVSEADAGLPVSAYGWSKRLAENILRASLGDRLVIVRPPIIYGSGDRGMLPVYKGLQKGLAVLPGLSGKFPVSAMHVRDVAQAIMLCCQDRASGVYHLNDGRVYSMKDIYLAASRAIGRKPRILRLPLWFMGLTAVLCTAAGYAARKLGAKRAPNWNIDKFREARQCGWTGSSARISSELGFEPSVDLDEGMSETMAGNHRMGLL